MTETTIEELEGLQRFLLRGGQGPAAQMVEDSHGAWVRYGDVQALLGRPSEREQRSSVEGLERGRGPGVPVDRIIGLYAGCDELEERLAELERRAGVREGAARLVVNKGRALGPSRLTLDALDPQLEECEDGELLEAEPAGTAPTFVLPDGCQLEAFGAGDRWHVEVRPAELLPAPPELEAAVDERLRSDASREELLVLRAEHEKLLELLGYVQALEGRTDEGSVADRVDALTLERLDVGACAVHRTWRQAAELERQRRDLLERELEELRKRSSTGDARPSGAGFGDLVRDLLDFEARIARGEYHPSVDPEDYAEGTRRDVFARMMAHRIDVLRAEGRLVRKAVRAIRELERRSRRAGLDPRREIPFGERPHPGAPAEKGDPLCRLCNGTGVIEQGPVDGRCATCNGTGLREERGRATAEGRADR